MQNGFSRLQELLKIIDLVRLRDHFRHSYFRIAREFQVCNLLIQLLNRDLLHLEM